MIEKKSKICVIGHKGMLGHALCEKLEEQGYTNIVGCDLPEVDLCDQLATRNFFETEKPEYVFFLAAVAGGIEYKKKYAADMMLKNLQMITNVMESVHALGVKKTINVCSALVYPRDAAMPLSEQDATRVDIGTIDAPYSVAKVAGLQLARFFKQQYGDDIVTVVPCNFFGPFAPFEGDKAGVVPSLIARIADAKEKRLDQVEVWGTGNACRDVLYVGDVADACIHLMSNKTQNDFVNIGRGKEYTIREIAETIKAVVGYTGELYFNADRPEGRQHMMMNNERLTSIGWSSKYDLRESIQKTFQWYREEYKKC